MNLQTILQSYIDDPRIKNLCDRHRMSEKVLRSRLFGLKGSSISFISAAVWKNTLSQAEWQGYNHVFVFEDRDKAAYFQNNIENITNGLDIFYFPDSFKKDKEFTTIHKSQVMMRTEALSRLSYERSGAIISTFPDALMEKVISSKELQENIIRFESGQEIQLDTIIPLLVDLGFKKADFVYEPGQFALRGGIFDIYSFGNEHPYRIELFGDEVDSIRIFNPESQLSERKLSRVEIIPNAQNNSTQSVLLSFMDFIPKNTIFWMENLPTIIGKMHDLKSIVYEKYVKEKDTQVLDELMLGEDEISQKKIEIDDYESPDYFIQKLSEHSIIEWTAHTEDAPPMYFTDDTFFLPSEKIDNYSFHTDAQPPFGRNFNLLISDIKEWQKKNYTVSIFADSAKQLERLYNIFRDVDTELEFISIPTSISEGFIDHDKNLIFYTDHQIFQRFHKYRVKQAYTQSKAITINTLKTLQPGDYVTHIDHGVGVFSGLQKIEVNGSLQEAVRIIYKDNDALYVNINSLHKISKFTGKEGHQPRVHKLGSDTWEKLKNKTKKQVKEIATDLIKLYAKRKAMKGFQHSPDNYLQTELEASFIYEDTPDQSRATQEVKKDMESPHPMDRLICGDVGFGKTEIAIRASFKTVCDSKQAAVLVPTTILAYQHYQSFSKRLKNFPCNVEFINRFKTAKEKKEIIQKIKEGKIDIIIGTHALLSKDIEFKDLGLLVIDEEQKFGVAAKEKLREKRTTVDTLTLSATPIPRTLQFSLMSARDLSIINTPPPNRQPVHTELVGFNEDIIRDAINYEIQRGGQVYFVHNRVDSLTSMASLIKSLCPHAEVEVAHGQMDGKEIERKLIDFIQHKIDVLCCTNIVESGVDISNANTIIINNAHHFGLSDLHQLRGRVGRSNKKAFCYLVAPSMITLPAESRRRLQILEQFSDLGSGFQIAMRDLDIRGAGNLLGGEQSGFITDIGFEMYQKILDEAIRELKRSEFSELFKEEIEKEKNYVQDCIIDTDLEILIPDSYIENTVERLSLYNRLDHLNPDVEMESFVKELEDRFGKIPHQVEELIATVYVRKMAKELGFERIILKNKTLRLYFISNPESPYFDQEEFHKILQYVQQRIAHSQVKQSGKLFYISIQSVSDMKKTKEMLTQMSKFALTN